MAVGLEVGVEVQMDWHKELERSLGGQGDSSLYDPAQYSAQLLQVKTQGLYSLVPRTNLQKIRRPDTSQTPTIKPPDCHHPIIIIT